MSDQPRLRDAKYYTIVFNADGEEEIRIPHDTRRDAIASVRAWRKNISTYYASVSAYRADGHSGVGACIATADAENGIQILRPGA